MKYNQEETNNEEKFVNTINSELKSKVPKEVQECYQFSNYLLDPKQETVQNCCQSYWICIKFYQQCARKIEG